jgi:hypothetical protein
MVGCLENTGDPSYEAYGELSNALLGQGLAVCPEDRVQQLPIRQELAGFDP